jgi:hypothetical protein
MAVGSPASAKNDRSEVSRCRALKSLGHPAGIIGCLESHQPNG